MSNIERADGWTARIVGDDIEICGPDTDLDVITMPLRAFRKLATAAIDASGTHWVAPWETSVSYMRDQLACDDYAAWRDACLAEREG